MTNHLPVIIFLIPFLTGICMPIIGLKFPQRCRQLALAASFAMAVVAVVNVCLVLEQGESRYFFGGWSIGSDSTGPPIGIEWVNDSLASVMLAALSCLGWLCLLYSGPVTPRTNGKRSVLYNVLVMMLLSGLTGAVFAGDIFNLFVFLELAALSAYALVGVAGGRALVAAFRYLMLGTLGASFYLLGVAFFYAECGTLNMADLAQQLSSNPKLMESKTVISGLTFMFIGLGIKMALFPLHGWLPGAYTRAPDAVSPMLAALMTKVALYALVRIMFWVLGAGTELGHVRLLTLLGGLGSVAMIVGALLAMSQSDIKRMFAYGGISHIGLILIGVSQGNSTGFAGSLFYLINDAIMQAGLFFIAGAAIHYHGARTVEDIARLRNGSPWIIGALIVLAMSMIGIPPTGGFFGKWQIILGAIEAGNFAAAGSVVLATLLTMAYFQRIFLRLFRDPQSEDAPRVEAHLSVRFSVAVVSAAVITLGLFSDPIIKFFRQTAAAVGLVVS